MTILTTVTVRPMRPADAATVLAIHQAGVGRTLLDAVIASTEAAGIWTIQSGVFPENTASRALHRAAGFEDVGLRRRIGRHASQGNRRRDVVFIERRSPVVD